MNTLLGLPMQILGGACFNESKVYEPYSSPRPVLPDPSEDFPGLVDPFSVSTSSDLLANPLEIQADPMVSQNSQSDLSPFPFGSPTDLHFSNCSPEESSTQNAAIISQPLGGGAHFPPHGSPCSDIPSVGHINCQEEDNYYSWSVNKFQGLSDFPEDIPLADSQRGTTVEVTSSENSAREIGWKEFAEDLCPGCMTSNWNELLGDPNMGNQLSEVPLLSSDIIVHQLRTQHRLSLSSTELPITISSSTPAQSNKTRMRWTLELHEAFVDAVNHLGGCDRAKPKAVLDHMNVEGLLLQHVKSHLQKYRSARVSPKSLEGNSQERVTATEWQSSVDLRTGSAITEALRIQMDVQKQLHEQLEMQRTLQLKFEEQGKYLLQMLQKQNKMEQKKPKPLPDNPSDPSTSGRDQPMVEAGSTSLSRAARETCGSKGEQKGAVGSGMTDGDDHFGADGSSPATKRAKIDDSFQYVG